MTVCGLIVTPELAAVWVDTEVFDGAQPAEHTNKLLTNALSGVVATGAGSLDLVLAAGPILADAEDVDDAADLLARRLRRRADAMLSATEADPGLVLRHTSIVAGWSPQAARMAGYRLAASSLFVPQLVSRVAIPHVPALDALDLSDPRALAKLAQAQLAALRAGYPGATGGALTLALVRASGGRGNVQTGVLLDLVTGRWAWPGCESLAPEPPAPAVPASEAPTAVLQRKAA